MSIPAALEGIHDECGGAVVFRPSTRRRELLAGRSVELVATCRGCGRRVVTTWSLGDVGARSPSSPAADWRTDVDGPEVAGRPFVEPVDEQQSTADTWAWQTAEETELPMAAGAETWHGRGHSGPINPASSEGRSGTLPPVRRGFGSGAQRGVTDLSSWRERSPFGGGRGDGQSGQRDRRQCSDHLELYDGGVGAPADTGSVGAEDPGDVVLDPEARAHIERFTARIAAARSNLERLHVELPSVLDRGLGDDGGFRAPRLSASMRPEGSTFGSHSSLNPPAVPEAVDADMAASTEETIAEPVAPMAPVLAPAPAEGSAASVEQPLIGLSWPAGGEVTEVAPPAHAPAPSPVAAAVIAPTTEDAYPPSPSPLPRMSVAPGVSPASTLGSMSTLAPPTAGFAAPAAAPPPPAPEHAAPAGTPGLAPPRTLTATTSPSPPPPPHAPRFGAALHAPPPPPVAASTAHVPPPPPPAMTASTATLPPPPGAAHGSPAAGMPVPLSPPPPPPYAHEAAAPPAPPPPPPPPPPLTAAPSTPAGVTLDVPPPPMSEQLGGGVIEPTRGFDWGGDEVRERPRRSGSAKRSRTRSRRTRHGEHDDALSLPGVASAMGSDAAERPARSGSRVRLTPVELGTIVVLVVLVVFLVMKVMSVATTGTGSGAAPSSSGSDSAVTATEAGEPAAGGDAAAEAPGGRAAGASAGSGRASAGTQSGAGASKQVSDSAQVVDADADTAGVTAAADQGENVFASRAE